MVLHHTQFGRISTKFWPIWNFSSIYMVFSKQKYQNIVSITKIRNIMRRFSEIDRKCQIWTLKGRILANIIFSRIYVCEWSKLDFAGHCSQENIKLVRYRDKNWTKYAILRSFGSVLTISDVAHLTCGFGYEISTKNAIQGVHNIILMDLSLYNGRFAKISLSTHKLHTWSKHDQNMSIHRSHFSVCLSVLKLPNHVQKNLRGEKATSPLVQLYGGQSGVFRKRNFGQWEWGEQGQSTMF